MISGAGQVHSGKLRMAKVGTRKENVPPWMIGNLESITNSKFVLKCELIFSNKKSDQPNLYLTPIVHWSIVMIPETNIMVELIAPRIGSPSSMQRAGVKMKGSDTVPPIIIK